MGRGLPGPPAADGPALRRLMARSPTATPSSAWSTAAGHRRPRPRHTGLPARGPARRRPDPAAPGNRKLEAVDTLLRGVFGPGYRAALDHRLPGAFDQAVADADAFFTQEMPALQQWPFTVLGQPPPRSSRNGRSCCCVGCQRRATRPARPHPSPARAGPRRRRRRRTSRLLRPSTDSRATLTGLPKAPERSAMCRADSHEPAPAIRTDRRLLACWRRLALITECDSISWPGAARIARFCMGSEPVGRGHHRDQIILFGAKELGPGRLR